MAAISCRDGGVDSNIRAKKDKKTTRYVGNEYFTDTSIPISGFFSGLRITLTLPEMYTKFILERRM